MTSQAHPDRPTPPSVREIAALTARLRELSGRDRSADPVQDEAERAVFLADKDALFARIPHAATDGTDSAGDGRVPHSHAAIIDRSEPPGTVDDAVHLDDLDRPWTVQGTTRDTAHAVVADRGRDGAVWLVMPEQMREQARRAEARIDDGTAGPAQLDDPAEIAARVAALRERIAARDTDPPTSGRADRGPAVPVPWVTVVETDQQEQRRDQLARWHTDDQLDHQDDSDSDAASPGSDAGRQVWVCDDAPDLP